VASDRDFAPGGSVVVRLDSSARTGVPWLASAASVWIRGVRRTSTVRSVAAWAVLGPSSDPFYRLGDVIGLDEFTV
jgi:hypothetical protein